MPVFPCFYEVMEILIFSFQILYKIIECRSITIVSACICIDVISNSFSCLMPGSCQGVIALNMEDGTLHRFRSASTILATGV